MSTDFEFEQKPAKEQAAPVTEAAAAPVTEKEEKPKYDPQLLAAIFDDILFQGEYAESVVIKDKLRVSFRTRSAEEITAMTRELDATSYNMLATLDEHRAILDLSYALTNFAGKDLTGMTIQERTKFIMQKPAPVIGMLSVKLRDFDLKVAAALEDAEGNF